MSDGKTRLRLEELFFAAAELEGEKRARYVQDLSDSDAALRPELKRLLQLDDQDSSPIDTPVLDQLEEREPRPDPAEWMPQRIGPYEVQGVLGVGGMGIVYEARQDSPGRLVALKLLRPEYGGSMVQKRFVREGEILARLKHESIAHIYEAGLAEVLWPGGATSEQPFLAMELVRGLPVHEYSVQQDLNTRQRVALITRIADAIEAAHQAGIVHRDLKPGNILVTSAGVPKVLDFGVARLLDEEQPNLTLQTHTGQVIGTIAYMSPEQITGDVSLITARSDVYSLGVLAYELLTGVLPHQVGRLSIPEAARIIQDEEPTRLGHLSAELRGDLETILGKALEKEPSRRYASAGPLAEDLRRHLSNEPILARPATRLYRMRKFTRRHPGLVYGTSATMLMLVLGVVFSTMFALRAAAGRKDAETALVKARQQTRKAEEIRAFLDRMLTAVDPDLSQGKEVTGVEIVDSAAKQLDARPPEDPEVEAAIRSTLGDTYRVLSKYSKARPQVERALALHLRIHGEDHEDTISARRALGLLMLDLQDLPRAEAELQRCRSYYESQGDEGLRGLSITLLLLASALIDRRQFRESEAVARLALEKAAPLVDNQLLRADGLEFIAMSRVWRGAYKGTEEMYQQALRLRQEHAGGLTTKQISLRSLIANLYELQGQHAKAEKLYVQMLADARKLTGKHSKIIAGLLLNLSTLRSTLHRYREAAEAARECIQVATKVYGPEVRMLADAHWTLANALSTFNKNTEAVHHFTLALGILDNSSNKGRLPAKGFVHLRLAGLYLGLGDTAKALHHAQSAFDIHKQLYQLDHDSTRASASMLADIYTQTQQAQEATKWRKLSQK